MTSDPIRIQYLEAMGIDVWLHKATSQQLPESSVAAGALPQGAVVDFTNIDSTNIDSTNIDSTNIDSTNIDPVASPTAVNSAVGEQQPVLAATPVEPVVTLESFSIRMLQYQNCLIIINVDQPGDGLPQGYQALLDDIAQAMTSEKGRCNIYKADWRAAMGGDPYQKLHAQLGPLVGAGNAYLIVMGDVARRLLFGAQIPVMTSTSFLGRAAIAVMDVKELLQSPGSKRLLWQKMLELQAGS